MIRMDVEALEAAILSPFGKRSAETKGRCVPEPSCDIRTEFQRDRDRILHSSAFRRLKHKTQVFLSPMGDHYRTRLTHTLEVSQIARTIARALRLNEDLTEGIALGHDLGHTPFGHAGERALAKVFPEGFVHSAQSVRVVDYIEKDGKGLNLTYEVRDGIRCHSDHGSDAQTLEGRVVRISDKIAYINHDIEDAIRAEVLRESDLPYDSLYVLGRTKSERISKMVRSIAENSKEDIQMDREVWAAHNRLKEFMFQAVYTNPVAKGEEGKAADMIETLYRHYLSHPQDMPSLYREIANREGEGRAVCDYIAGMTDQYAVECFRNLYIPRFWFK